MEEVRLEMALPAGKRNRLADFDYSCPNGFFITVCTAGRPNLFWDNAGAVSDRPLLSPWGRLVEETICQVPAHYPLVPVEKYVVMPNHIHLLLQIHDGGRSVSAPTVSFIV